MPSDAGGQFPNTARDMHRQGGRPCRQPPWSPIALPGESITATLVTAAILHHYPLALAVVVRTS